MAGKRKWISFIPEVSIMGVRADVYRKLGGFSKMRFGEDIDFSIRIFKAGCRCRLFPEAWVWHKRRTDLKKFFKQVHNSGIARINYIKISRIAETGAHASCCIYGRGSAGAACFADMSVALLLLALFRSDYIC